MFWQSILHKGKMGYHICFEGSPPSPNFVAQGVGIFICLATALKVESTGAWLLHVGELPGPAAQPHAELLKIKGVGMDLF